MSDQPYSTQELRHGAWHFVTGRAASALISFATLITLVRLLPIDQYGAYVTFVAWLEFLLALSGFGLPWLAARYVPELRMHGSGRQMLVFVRRLLVWQSSALLFILALAAMLLDFYLASAGLTRYRMTAAVYLFVILVEGISRQMIESALGPLMLQKVVRASLVARQALFLVLVLTLFWSLGDPGLEWVVGSELIASTVGGAFALSAIWRYFRHSGAKPASAAWVEPGRGEMWRISLNMYFVHLAALLYSPQVLLVAVQRFTGSEAAAVFGFLRGLYGQIARFLPATLLFSLLRPKLVASYVGGQGIKNLARIANLMGKLNLIALMPAVAFAAVGGETLVALLSGGKFQGTGLLLFGLMLGLLPFSQRQLVETVAVVTGQSDLCSLASLTGFLMPLLLAVLLVPVDAGLWAPVAVMGIGHLVFNTVILIGMRRRTGYTADAVGAMRLALALPLGYLSALAMPNTGHAALNTGLQILAGSCGFIAAAFIFRSFSSAEIVQLRKIVLGAG